MSFMFFPSNIGTNSVVKTASQILWWLQWTSQAEGGPPLPGEVSRQGYPGSLGSASRVLLKAMSFAEYFYLKELIFSDWNHFRWKTPTLLLLKILTRVLITMLILNLLIAALCSCNTNLWGFFNRQCRQSPFVNTCNKVIVFLNCYLEGGSKNYLRKNIFRHSVKNM